MLAQRFRSQFFVVCLLVQALVVQAIIPMGFMPSSIAAGRGLFQVCPAQQPELFEAISNQSGQSHHHDHPSHSLESSNDCQWGQLIVGFFLTLAVFIPSVVRSQYKSVAAVLPIVFLLFLPPIRAPPLIPKVLEI